MSAEEGFKPVEQNDTPKAKADEWGIPAPERQVNPLAVLSNSKIPKEDLEAFYDYCKQNPKAKEAVDTVIKAFSPDKIGEFIKNCKQVPLPTDADSYEGFCRKYEMQLRNVQEAPKQETVVVEDKTVIARHDSAVAEDKTVVAVNTVEKQEISEKRQEILTILTSWNNGKGYPDLLKKYGEFFKDSQSYPADSAEFRQAINGLLKELVLDAQKTGDGKDALQVAKAAYAMNAISEVDYARLSRELAELQAPRALDKAGDWASKTDLPAGFHQMTTRAGEGEKFVNFALGSGKGKCDEVVSFPKDGDGKGNKTLVSAHSGYAVELVGVVDGREKALLAKESGLRGNLDKAQENLKTIAEAKAQLQAVVDGADSENAADDPSEPENPQVAKAKAQLAEIEEKGYEKENQAQVVLLNRELEKVVTDLSDKSAWGKEKEKNRQREKAAREAIAFVDGLGLGVLGAENVQGFFDLVSEKSGLADHAKINPAERAIDDHQKRLIMKMFARLLGSADGAAGMFDPTTLALREGKTEGEVREGLIDHQLPIPIQLKKPVT